MPVTVNSEVLKELSDLNMPKACHKKKFLQCLLMTICRLPLARGAAEEVG